MAVPKEIVVEYAEPERRPKHFMVHGVGLAGGKLRIDTFQQLLAFLSKHDYRAVLGEVGVWRLV